MRCSCGFQCPEGMRFCGQCGSPLPLACPACGFVSQPGMRFCGMCGGPLAATPRVKGAEAGSAPYSAPQQPYQQPTSQPAAGPASAPAEVTEAPIPPPLPEPPPMPPLPAAAAAPAPQAPPAGFAPPEDEAGLAGPARSPELTEISTADEQRLQQAQSYIPQSLTEKILSAGKEIGGERRNVTVLFTDVSGFTAMSEKLDPEDVYSIMNDCFKDLVEIIYKYEGVVDKFIGDAIMALFGAPVAHEDDAERAVRTALEMQAKIGLLSSDIEAKYGVPIHMRVGINTGEVVAGGVGSDLRMDYTVMGDTVNLASRLESNARVDTVLISESTFNPVRHVFDAIKIPPLSVKNKAEPVTAFEVVGLKRVREDQAKRSSFVGREEELAALVGSVEETSSDKGCVFALTGDVGLGKSRLSEEARDRALDNGMNVLEGKCLSYQTSVSYGIFLEVLSQHFGFSLQDPDEEMQLRIEAALPPSMAQNKGFFHFLFSITSDEAARVAQLNAEQLKNQTVAAIRDLLLDVARDSALLLLLDDLQWIDSISIEVVESLARVAAEKKVMLLCISRAAGSDSKVDAIGRLQGLKPERYRSIVLEPMDESDVNRLFRVLSKAGNLPATIRNSVLNRAEGNPLYVEELFHMMMDEGILTNDENGWSYDVEALKELKISPTIQGLMLSRVDRLPQEEKKILQNASVIGKDFTLKLLQAISVGGGTEALDASLERLCEGGFVELVTDRSREDPEFTFKHLLIQETVYQGLLVKNRAALHDRIGEAIENVYPDKTNEMIFLLAYHFGFGSNKLKKIGYSIRAGEKALRAFANDDAVNFYDSALSELAPGEMPDSRRQCLEGLAQIDFVRSEYQASLEKYGEALQLVDAEEAPLVAANIREKMGKSLTYSAKFEEALETLEKGLACSRKGGEKTAEEARILSMKGWALYNLGRYDEALASCELAESILAGGEPTRDLASALNIMGGIRYDLGLWGEAVGYYEKSLEIVQALGDLDGISACHTNIGLILCDQGKVEEAIEHHKKSLTIENKLGNSYGVALSLNNMGMAHLTAGRWAKARKYFDRALHLCENAGDTWDFLPEVELYLAEIEVLNADFSKALELAEKALNDSREMGSSFYEARSNRVIGMVQRFNRRYAEALKALDSALMTFREQEVDLEIGRTLVERASLYRRMAEKPGAEEDLAARASADLDEAASTFEKLGIKRDLQRIDEARAELKELAE